LVIKALDPDWIRIGIQPKMLDPYEINADPQPCLMQRTTLLLLTPPNSTGGSGATTTFPPNFSRTIRIVLATVSA
jgi:hypothetical protein